MANPNPTKKFTKECNNIMPEPPDLGPAYEHFATQDELDAYVAGDTIKCLICEKEVAHISNHVRLAHGIHDRQYREHFGIPYKFPLMPKPLRDQLAARMLERLEHEPRLKERHKDPTAVIRHNRKTGWSANSARPRLELMKEKMRYKKGPRKKKPDRELG